MVDRGSWPFKDDHLGHHHTCGLGAGRKSLKKSLFLNKAGRRADGRTDGAGGRHPSPPRDSSTEYRRARGDGRAGGEKYCSGYCGHKKV